MKRLWTPEEVAYLVEHYPHRRTDDVAAELGRKVGQVYNKADKLGLKKTPEYLESPDACRLDGLKGIGTRFTAGHATWNAGMKGWDAGGRSAETRFKAGQMPHNWNPVGHERISKDGYLERKITDTGCTRRDYVAVHRLLWIEHNGPIPDGHIVVFRDKNPRNIVIENLEMITRQENARRNSIHRYPKEIADTIRQLSGLRRRIKNIERERKESHEQHSATA